MADQSVSKYPKADAWYRRGITLICFVMCAIQVGNFILPPMKTTSFFVLHFMFGMLMCYLIYDWKGKKTYLYGPGKLPDLLMALAAVAVAVYILRDVDGYLTRIQISASNADIVMGIVVTLLVLEACRRLTGPSLTTIALVTILYAFWGKYLPGLLGHKGYSLQRVVKTIFSDQGVFGMPIGVSANTVFLFLLFGAFLNVCGADLIFRDISIALAGKARGGPAKIAIVASGIFGSISGSAVANVVSTGAFTIPMMKRTGYRKEFAGAVEAVASTGGQLMPPIMGAAAFILAEMAATPYGAVCVAAAIPAFLYYISVFIMVDVEAIKADLQGMDPKDVPRLGPVLRRGAKLLIPVGVLIFTLVVLQKTPMKSALYAMAAVIICALLDKEDRFSWRHLAGACSSAAKGSAQIIAACCTSGIVIGMLAITGLGLKFSNFILALGGTSLITCLAISMIVSIILGMGLPTTAAYIITATTIAPALLKLGLSPLCAHLFLFYFASLSCITPPVAIASYAGAALAEASPTKVGWEAVRLGIVAFLIPYAFALNPAVIILDFSSLWAAVDTCLSAILTLLAAIPIAYAVQGHSYKPLPVWTRLLCVLLGCCLIVPNLLVELPAAAVTVAIFLLHRREYAVAHPPLGKTGA